MIFSQSFDTDPTHSTPTFHPTFHPTTPHAPMPTQGEATHLKSQFRLTYSMIMNLIRVENLHIEDMMKRSFAEYANQKNITKNEVGSRSRRGRKREKERERERERER